MANGKDKKILGKKAPPSLQKLVDVGLKTQYVEDIPKSLMELPPANTHARTLEPITVGQHAHETKLQENTLSKKVTLTTESKDPAPRKVSPQLEPIIKTIPKPSPPKVHTEILSESHLKVGLQPVRTSVPDAANVINSSPEPPAELTVSPDPPIEPPITAPQNGNVKILYELYNEEFPIADGVLTAAAIDGVYCLSDIMPHCRIRLSSWSPSRIRQFPEMSTDDSLYIAEEPPGSFVGLQAGGEYYCYIQQDSSQVARERSVEKVRNQMAATQQSAHTHEVDVDVCRDDGRGFDTCSCIYGSPCVVSSVHY